MRHRECLIIFTRYPEPGTTKTRLIPHLGRRGAADIQRQMTGHVLAQALPLMTSRELELEIRYEGGDARLMRAWLGDAVTMAARHRGYRPAHGAGLSRRDGSGDTSIVLIGTDIPDITTALLIVLLKSFTTIRSCWDRPWTAAITSSVCRRMMWPAEPGLFSDIAWGTATVLQETCRRLKERFRLQPSGNPGGCRSPGRSSRLGAMSKMTRLPSRRPVRDHSDLE